MTDPLLAHSTKFGRMYARSVDSQPEVPSITTIISQEGVDLASWHGRVAAQAVLANPRLMEILGHEGKVKYAVTKASTASEKYRQEAAERGDRVHAYAENVALRALGRQHEVEKSFNDLCEHNEQNFAASFDQWWRRYNVKPREPEITVWNQDVGYAGTLDLVATIAGRTCIIDYKTKSSDWKGDVYLPDEKVVMQLVAGVKATEVLDDAQTGLWKTCTFRQEDPLLLTVAIGQNQTKTAQANPAHLSKQWNRFLSLNKLWQNKKNIDKDDSLLLMPPPAF